MNWCSFSPSGLRKTCDIVTEPLLLHIAMIVLTFSVNNECCSREPTLLWLRLTFQTYYVKFRQISLSFERKTLKLMHEVTMHNVQGVLRWQAASWYFSLRIECISVIRGLACYDISKVRNVGEDTRTPDVISIFSNFRFKRLSVAAVATVLPLVPLAVIHKNS